jgi:uroporphyrinogen III methyltransferase/synthase
MPGTVYLVGGGPGDPGLLTVRAARLLKRSDVVVHDALISAGILDLLRPSAERVDVGKRCGGRRTAQARIHEILVDAARRARVVVRLKGGDPFIFGRGGEEAIALRKAGVRFEVVPGITAAAGVAAYAGIPLTHRNVSSSVTLVTGHECATSGAERVDWERIGRSEDTLVIYMGSRRLAEIADRLIMHGRSPLTPTAVVQCGTDARQRTIAGSLYDVANRVEMAGVRLPALVVVGDVVSLRARMEWFEARPLHGRKILVPRSRGQRSRLARTLRARGAEVIEFPRMVVRPPSSKGALRAALWTIDEYDWVLFTSPTAVERFWDAAVDGGLDARRFTKQKFACLGAATIAALRQRGLRADIAERSFVPARLAAALARSSGLVGRAVLFPRNVGPQSHLTTRLTSAGARVHEVAAYREEIEAGRTEAMRQQLRSGDVSVVAFTSSQTVRHFTACHGTDVGDATVAVIGPATAKAARAAGLPVHLLPHDFTLRGLLRTIQEHATETSTERDHAGAGAGGSWLTPQCQFGHADIPACRSDSAHRPLP